MGEVCQFRGGGTPSKAVKRYWQGEIPWVSPKDMKSNVICDSIDHISADAINNSAAALIPKGAVLMVVRSGILTRTVPLAVTGGEVAINQDLKALCPDKNLKPEFLYYFLQSRMSDLLSRVSRGATVHRLSTDDIRALEIAIPPLAEQTRIVGILDRALVALNTAEGNSERNVLNVQELLDSCIDAQIAEIGHSYPASPLVDLCESGRVVTYGVIKLGKHVSNGVPCLRTSNVRRLRIDTEGMKVITPELSAAYSRTILKGGEVLVNVRGTLGGVAVVTSDMVGWNVSREVAVVPLDCRRVDPAFVAYVIASRSSQDWLAEMKKGATYVGINIEDLRKLPIVLPPMNEQANVVADIEAVMGRTERVKANMERKARLVESLRKSVLHHAFNGTV